MFSHKWIFCFTTVKIVCSYWNFPHSGSINSTSLLFSFIKVVLIYNNMNSKKLSKKINSTRYEWKRFWCFKVYYLSAPVRYHSHIIRQWEVRINRSSSCVKRRSIYHMNNAILQRLHSAQNAWIRSEIRCVR